MEASAETLQDPSKELWLIRAPASFSPESLNGHSVPLLGFQILKASQPDGTEKIFHVQTTLQHLSGACLLVPSGHGDHLACCPPFNSSLSICERYGDPSDNRPLFPVVARPAPQIPEGLKPRFLPFGSHLERALLPRKKKKAKKHRLGKQDFEEVPALFGTPLGKAGGAGKTEAGCQCKEEGAAPLANGSQPSSAVVSHDSLPSGEGEDPGPRSKKKKKKKRKENQEVKETGAEAGHQHEEEGAATWAVGSLPEAQQSSAAVAQDSLLSGEGEAPGPTSKKKKKRKKRKEDGEPKDEMGAEAEVTGLHENRSAPWTIGSQPSSEPLGQDGLLSGEAADPGPRSKKKKKRKEGQEVKDRMGGEGLVDLSSCLGGGSETHAGEDSLPGMEEVTQHTPKGERKEKAVLTEPASNMEEAARGLWDFSSLGATPGGRLVLALEEPGVGSSSHKAKKRRKEKEKPKEGAQELGRQPAPLEVESWAQLGTPLLEGGGQEAEPGMEELSPRPKKKKHHPREALEPGLAGQAVS